MARLVAFLRAVNVGGRTVPMVEVKALFEAMGLQRVDPFLASGNIAFSAADPSLPGLADALEANLHEALGFEVETFLRTAEELHALVEGARAEASHLPMVQTHCVAFLKAPLPPSALATLAALETEHDTIRAEGTELHWRSMQKQSESAISNAFLERRLGVRMTLRGFNTLQRLSKRMEGTKA